MTMTSFLSDLPSGRRNLVQIMQRLFFGRIERLHFRDGQPIFDPAPRLVREHKFGAENQPRPDWTTGDFLIKAKVLELFTEIDRLGTGIITLIEVKNGLPFRMFIADSE